jgi:hypothetical protein
MKYKPTGRVQRGKEAEGFRRVRKPVVNSVVAVVFSYFLLFTSLRKGGGFSILFFET